MINRREVIAVLSAGLAFGVAVAVVKGQDTGARDVLGNTSAPWVVMPFLAGARARRVRHGALMGIAVTLAAFAGFYAAEAAILDLGPHPWYVDLRLTMGTFNVYEKFGLLSGLVYGALGTVWATHRRIEAPIAVALAFVLEPPLVLLLERSGIWGGGQLLAYSWIWIGEMVIGAVAAAAVVHQAARSHDAAS